MKKQNGITLVALVITIIILLILAGVTLSIVFNGGIIEKSQNAVESYNYSSKNEDAKLADLEARFTQLYNERLAENEKGLGDESTNARWEIVTDYGTAGLSLGDLIKPKNLTGTNAYLANEKFYVIGIGTESDPVITLLAEKNVKTNDSTAANNIQNLNSGSANTIAFDSSINKYANASINGLVDTYVNKLIAAGLTLEDVETVEGGTAVSGIKGRLMWGTNSSGEVQNVLAINATGTNSITGSTIVYGPDGAKVTYWLGSPYSYDAGYAWRVNGTNDINVDHVYHDSNYRSSPGYKSFTV